MVAPVGKQRATGSVDRRIRKIRERLMVYRFQTPRPALKKVFQEKMLSTYMTTHQSRGCSPLEVHFGRKPNTI